MLVTGLGGWVSRARPRSVTEGNGHQALGCPSGELSPQGTQEGFQQDRPLQHHTGNKRCYV